MLVDWRAPILGVFYDQSLNYFFKGSIGATSKPQSTHATVKSSPSIDTLSKSSYHR